jgi:hypothetical protein
MSKLKLMVGEYYYDTEGAIVGPIEENPTPQNPLYKFFDGKLFRMENGWATNDGVGLPTIHRIIDRSEHVHPEHPEWLVDTHHTTEETVTKKLQPTGFINEEGTMETFDCTTMSGCFPSEPTLKEKYAEYVHTVFSEMEELIRQKNNDYSHGDDPFANFRKSEEMNISPLAGLVLRMQDKMQRINAYLCRGTLEVPGEGVEDAFRDLIGYSCLALGMINLDERGEV